MPDSTYDRIRKQECEWCAKGATRWCRAYDGCWVHQNPLNSLDIPCTAPSRDEVIERLAADKEILDWLELRRVGLNKHCGSNYGWKFVASHNVNRLYVRDLNTIDLHDTGPAGGGDMRAVVKKAMQDAAVLKEEPNAR